MGTRKLTANGNAGITITTRDDQIAVSLNRNKIKLQNNFVDYNEGSFSVASCWSGNGIFALNVNMNLQDINSTVVATTEAHTIGKVSECQGSST